MVLLRLPAAPALRVSRCINLFRASAITCVFARQITIKGHEIGESPAAQTALLENGPEMDSATAENVVYKVRRRSLR